MHKQIKDGKETTAVKRYLVSIGIVLLVLGSPLQAGYVYWSCKGAKTINRLNSDWLFWADDTNKETVVADAGTPGASLAIDALHGKLFWDDGDGRTIWIANLDGTGARAIVATSDNPNGIAVDPVCGKIYWTEGLTSGRIMRSNLDGTDVATVLTMSEGYGTGIALDIEKGLLYWANYGTSGNDEIGGIYTARLDGTEVKQIVRTQYGTLDMAIDPKHGKLYWTHEYGVEQSNLDGSGKEGLLYPIQGGHGLSLDLASDNIYYAESGGVYKYNLENRDLVGAVLLWYDSPASIAFFVPEPSGSLLFLIGCSVLLRKNKCRAA